MGMCEIMTLSLFNFYDIKGIYFPFNFYGLRGKYKIAISKIIIFLSFWHTFFFCLLYNKPCQNPHDCSGFFWGLNLCSNLGFYLYNFCMVVNRYLVAITHHKNLKRRYFSLNTRDGSSRIKCSSWVLLYLKMKHIYNQNG